MSEHTITPILMEPRFRVCVIFCADIKKEQSSRADVWVASIPRGNKDFNLFVEEPVDVTIIVITPKTTRTISVFLCDLRFV